MIVTVRKDSDPALVKRELVARGLWVDVLEGGERTHLAIAPFSRAVAKEELLAIRGVESVSAPKSPHPRLDAMPRVIQVGGVEIGRRPVVLAGPCSIESEAEIHAIAERLAARGVRFLRGGAFKPRTSPYSFQGHGETALRWIREAADRFGMKVVTEAMGERESELVARFTDVLQIGSRNMHDYSLLKAVARLERPILLKRGMAATIEEWLAAAEYCLLHGASQVIFCERGIRSFDPSTRNVLDLGAVALLAKVMQLPVIVDPSHAAGRRDLIPPLARAAIAAGAAGLMLETHDDPGRALSDGPQALSQAELDSILRNLADTEAHHD
jgi:3-deoxy-7-phosphoheptulonate synthase